MKEKYSKTQKRTNEMDEYLLAWAKVTVADPHVVMRRWLQHKWVVRRGAIDPKHWGG